ncbi:hypothetical protein SSX86_022382 [Deinandra increscens subsp. villosa]|uniref:Uncharacterized protein n=1 Tax=Deinandra increscens subsp. villosa TaxID=3103831 RepID=A0AAP0CK94_9ASTR
MAEDKENLSMPFNNKNPLKLFLATKWKEFQASLKTLPPVLLESAVAAVDRGVHGAVFSYYLQTVSVLVFASSAVPPPRFISLKATQKARLMTARDMAVLMGTDAGVSRAMIRMQGKENQDVRTRMVSGFIAGVLFSIVRREPPARVIFNGVLLALAKNLESLTLNQIRKKDI